MRRMSDNAAPRCRRVYDGRFNQPKAAAMVATCEDDITAAVLAEAARTPDARQRELLTAAVKHLHAFVREVRLTEPEFFRLVSALARAGQMTTASHNEVMLGAGALG